MTSRLTLEEETARVFIPEQNEYAVPLPPKALGSLQKMGWGEQSHGLGGYKGALSSGHSRAWHDELTAVGTACTRPVQAQGRPDPSMEGEASTKSQPQKRSYWQLLAAGRGGVRFLQE